MNAPKKILLALLVVLVIFAITYSKKGNNKHEKSKIVIPDTTQIGSSTDYSELPIAAYKTKDSQTYTIQLLTKYGYSDGDIRKFIYQGKLIPIELTTMLDNKKMSLWSSLTAANLFDSSFENFQRKYNSRESVNYLFNGMSHDGIYQKSLEDFFKDYFPELTR